MQSSGTNCYGQVRRSPTCTRVMEGGRCGEKTGTAHGPKHTTSSVKHSGWCVMAWACTAATGTGSLVFTDDVTADSSSRMNSELYRNVLSAQIQPNASNLISQQTWVKYVIILETNSSVLNWSCLVPLSQTRGPKCRVCTFVRVSTTPEVQWSVENYLNWPKTVSQHFSLQQNNYLKHTANATKDFYRAKKQNMLEWPSQ